MRKRRPVQEPSRNDGGRIRVLDKLRPGCFPRVADQRYDFPHDQGSGQGGREHQEPETEVEQDRAERLTRLGEARRQV